eukprot:s7022_g5.t1
MSLQAELGSQLWLCAKYRAEHPDMLKAPCKQNAFDSGPQHDAISRKESCEASIRRREEMGALCPGFGFDCDCAADETQTLKERQAEVENAMAAPGDFVSLTVRLVDRSRTVEKAWQGTTYLSVWHLGRDVGMLELSSLNGRGYLFTHDGRRWSNLIHPNLRLSDVGVKEGSVVEFSGDFDKSAGTPLILQVHLMDRSKTTEEFGAVLPEACVWDLGMSLGMEKLSTLGGHIFSFEGRRWKSLEHPSLTFAEVVGGGSEGQELLVAFEGDFTSRDLPSSDAEAHRSS